MMVCFSPMCAGVAGDTTWGAFALNEALIAAIANGDVGAAEAQLAAGAEPNAKNAASHTPLHVAIAHGAALVEVGWGERERVSEGRQEGGSEGGRACVRRKPKREREREGGERERGSGVGGEIGGEERVERVRETNEIGGGSQERAKENCYSLLFHTLYGYNTVYGYNQ